MNKQEECQECGHEFRAFEPFFCVDEMVAFFTMSDAIQPIEVENTLTLCLKCAKSKEVLKNFNFMDEVKRVIE